MRLPGIGNIDIQTYTAKFRNFPAYLRYAAIALIFFVFVFGIYLLDNIPGKTSQSPKHHASSAHPPKGTQQPSASKSSSAVNPPAPQSGQGSASSAAPSVLPASILSLTSWKLTLPIGSPGDPDEITQPQLANYALSPYFQVNPAGSGVQFMAPVGGVSTSGSKFPRSELREMTANGSNEASWATSQGTSTMTLRESIDHLPDKRPELVAAQIHGAKEYIILVRLNGNDLFVEGNGKNLGDLNANYKLGTIFDLQITAQSGHILVSYNGTQKVDYANTSSGDYFKAGCYTQSNPSYGDSTSSYGQTTIYNIGVSHT